MLTQSEKRWLKKRKGWSVCSYCSNIPQTMCLYGERPHFCALLDVDHKDAAEFEGRVAAKLAIAYVFRGDNPLLLGGDNSLLTCKDCPANGCSKHTDGCDECILKWARLTVEEEMDNEMDN